MLSYRGFLHIFRILPVESILFFFPSLNKDTENLAVSEELCAGLTVYCSWRPGAFSKVEIYQYNFFAHLLDIFTGLLPKPILFSLSITCAQSKCMDV